MTPRDSNHTIRYVAIRTKRLYHQNAQSHLECLWESSVDMINALARSILGLGAVIFYLSGEICLKGQKRFVRDIRRQQ